MGRKATIITVVIVIAFGILLGLTQEENKRYSYKA